MNGAKDDPKTELLRSIDPTVGIERIMPMKQPLPERDSDYGRGTPFTVIRDLGIYVECCQGVVEITKTFIESMLRFPEGHHLVCVVEDPHRGVVQLIIEGPSLRPVLPGSDAPRVAYRIGADGKGVFET